MKICDAHLHFFSWDFFYTLACAAAKPTGEKPEKLLQRIALEAGFELPPRDPVEHLQRWLGQMDLHGVDKAVVLSSIPEEADAVHEVCADADDRLIPFTMLNPAAPDGLEFAKRALGEMEFRGVLLFPSLHHYQLTGEACLPVIEEARTANAVVVVHCGMLVIKIRDLLGFPRVYDIRFANPLDVLVLANRFPTVPFIIPHFGAGLFRETLIAGNQCPNIFVDTSSSNAWIQTQPEGLNLDGVFQRALSVFGSERILFGTDSTTFPRGWRSDVYRSQAVTLERLGISITERNRIFGENLQRLLDLHP